MQILGSTVILVIVYCLKCGTNRFGTKKGDDFDIREFVNRTKINVGLNVNRWQPTVKVIYCQMSG